MRNIHSNEAFKTVDGRFQFQYVSLIIKVEDQYFVGKWSDRFNQPSHISDVYDRQRLEIEDRGPVMKDTWALCTTADCYVKTPSLFTFASKVDLETRISREIQVCEAMRLNPHRHLASYLGCHVTRGRVSGICFQKYASTLLDRVNPQHLNKTDFLSSDRALVDAGLQASMDGIRQTIVHLHSLGYVHNDINPANLMLDHNDMLVLIDFDSCRRIGESLPNTDTKRTHGWHDPRVTVATEENDLRAFSELKTWLYGSAATEYLFGQI